VSENLLHFNLVYSWHNLRTVIWNVGLLYVSNYMEQWS